MRALPVTPLLCVDIIVERVGGPRAVLLVERRHPPHGWALPGGFVDVGESCEAAAVRELREETNLHGELLCQLHTYSDPSRDPRRPTASVVFVARAHGEPQAGDDAGQVAWWPLDALPTLCFDHATILNDYRIGRHGFAAPRVGM
ncbi:MAG: NUDIX hydrolase [Myxococcales bacterium]|nr:NUDIX hydrolase [Myxococcales bacterium]